MFVEGNTPARDIHIIRNFNPLRNPWFIIYDDAESVQINVFHFNATDLRQF